ncbi:hypothetical protein [Nonomuraea jabiensis]
MRHGSDGQLPDLADRARCPAEEPQKPDGTVLEKQLDVIAYLLIGFREP